MKMHGLAAHDLWLNSAIITLNSHGPQPLNAAIPTRILAADLRMGQLSEAGRALAIKALAGEIGVAINNDVINAGLTGISFTPGSGVDTEFMLACAGSGDASLAQQLDWATRPVAEAYCLIQVIANADLAPVEW